MEPLIHDQPTENINMDKNQIRNIIERVKIEQWPYSFIFERLKKAGVEAYEVKLNTLESTYWGGQQTWKKPISLNLLPLTIKNNFSINKVADIWDRHQKAQTSYTMFIYAAASAGVESYRVDMGSRTITFYGINSTKQHCEHIHKV